MRIRIPYLVGVLIMLILLAAGCNLFAPPPTPTVPLVPSSGSVNSRITIVGTGFGSAQGTGYVALGGVPASILSWSDTTIAARVPLLPTPGGQPDTVAVVVSVGDKTVGRGSFTIVRGILYSARRAQEQVICLANPIPDVSEAFDLTSGETDGYPQWSPDGTRVAFVRGPGSAYAGDIYVVNADGSDETRLTQGSDLNLFPAWSPDGTRIVFETTRDGKPEIYVMDADGFNQTNVTQSADEDLWPSWSPDGTKIVFYRVRHLDLVPLTSGDVAAPRVLFTNFEIYVMNADGTGQTDISNNLAKDTYPLWSPDGGKILFHTFRDGQWELFSMNPDGSGQTNLTQDSGEDAEGAWSPDGSRIAYIVFAANTDVYVMNADGSGQIRLTNNPGWDGEVSWSPDGAQIVFSSQREGESRIYIMDEDGMSVRRLTNEESFDPVWTTARFTPSIP